MFLIAVDLSNESGQSKNGRMSSRAIIQTRAVRERDSECASRLDAIVAAAVRPGVTLTMTHSVPELVLLGARGNGSRVLDDDDPRSLLRLLRRLYRRCRAGGCRGVRACRRRRGGLLLLLLLRRRRRRCLVELEEVIDLGVENPLFCKDGGAAGLVRQGQWYVLGRLVAEQVVTLEVTDRLDYRLEVLARRVCQVEPRLRRSVVQ